MPCRRRLRWRSRRGAGDGCAARFADVPATQRRSRRAPPSEPLQPNRALGVRGPTAWHEGFGSPASFDAAARNSVASPSAAPNYNKT